MERRWKKKAKFHRQYMNLLGKRVDDDTILVGDHWAACAQWLDEIPSKEPPKRGRGRPRKDQEEEKKEDLKEASKEGSKPEDALLAEAEKAAEASVGPNLKYEDPTLPDPELSATLAAADAAEARKEIEEDKDAESTYEKKEEDKAEQKQAKPKALKKKRLKRKV